MTAQGSRAQGNDAPDRPACYRATSFSGPKHWHVFDIIARRPLGVSG